MKKFALAALLSMFGAAANATVLTFDDIPGQFQNGVGLVNNYQGFTFNQTLYSIDVVGSSWDFGAHSGEYALLNNYGGTGIVAKADGSDFSFDGLWAKTWAFGATRSGTIRGYKDNALVWSTTLDINGTTYTNFGAQSGMIDALHMDLGNYFLVDDLALDQPAQNEVPEPASLALFGLAFAGLAAARSKQA